MGLPVKSKGRVCGRPSAVITSSGASLITRSVFVTPQHMWPDLLRGDFRCLYLGWLLSLQNGEISGGMLEPPVPDGLAELSAPLNSLTSSSESTRT
jgi:hypothetical protein